MFVNGSIRKAAMTRYTVYLYFSMWFVLTYSLFQHETTYNNKYQKFWLM